MNVVGSCLFPAKLNFSVSAQWPAFWCNSPEVVSLTAFVRVALAEALWRKQNSIPLLCWGNQNMAIAETQMVTAVMSSTALWALRESQPLGDGGLLRKGRVGADVAAVSAAAVAGFEAAASGGVPFKPSSSAAHVTSTR
jgi:hypothetical protein